MSVQINNPLGTIVKEPEVKTVFTVDGCVVTLEGPLSVVSRLAAQITSRVGDSRTFRYPLDGGRITDTPYRTDYLWNGPLTKTTPYRTWDNPLVKHD